MRKTVEEWESLQDERRDYEDIEELKDHKPWTVKMYDKNVNLISKN